MEKINISN